MGYSISSGNMTRQPSGKTFNSYLSHYTIVNSGGSKVLILKNKIVEVPKTWENYFYSFVSRVSFSNMP